MGLGSQEASMIATLRSLASLNPNPAWASLPLFDRTGWRRIAFGVFAESIGERAEPRDAQEEVYVGLEHLDPQCLHIRRWGKGSDVTGTKLRFRKGDIIFGRRRAYQRKLAMAEFDGICSAHAMVVRARPDKVLSEFLPLLMMSDRFMNRAVEISVGSLSPTINWTTLKLETFDLPPLDQQRRIAEILWAVDASLGANDELESSLLEYRQTFLDSITHEYSVSHALAPLDSAIEQGRPICYGILMPGVGVEDGIPVVKVRDFPDGYIREGDLLRTTPEIEAPYKRSRLKSGDLLISIRGTIGRMAEVPPSLDGANITQDTARLSIAPEHNRGYLRGVLESRFVERQLRSRITGLAVKGINIGELRQIQIPLPSRPKQNAIAEKLAAVSAAQKAAAEKSKQQRNLMSTSIDALIGGTSP
jgi:hypothetical protein